MALLGVCAEGKVRKVFCDGHGCTRAPVPARHHPNAVPQSEPFGDGQDVVQTAGHVSLPLWAAVSPSHRRQRVPVPVPPPRRHGLSEAELKDVLSLDDEVLQVVYRDWTPPSKELLRFPPLLWVRLRRDLGHCLARRPVDGFTLLAIAHRWVQRGGSALWVPESEDSRLGLLLVPEPSSNPGPSEPAQHLRVSTSPTRTQLSCF